MTPDSEGAIKCVYDDIDSLFRKLAACWARTPAVRWRPFQAGAGEAFDVIAGNGPIDANGDPIAGAVIIASGTATLPDGEAPAFRPTSRSTRRSPERRLSEATARLHFRRRPPEPS